MGDSVKMKLFSLFAVFSAAAASNVEIWDEYGNVAYVDYEERGNANFGPPAKGPRECDGKKIPEVKRGKFICKALKKNKAKDSNSKGSKKKKCKFTVTTDGKSSGPNRVKHPRKHEMVKSNASPATDGSQSQNHSNVSKNKQPLPTYHFFLNKLFSTKPYYFIYTKSRLIFSRG